MISRDRIANVQEAMSTIDASDGLWSNLGSLEEWWVLNIGGRFIPVVELSLGCSESLPHL